MKLEKWPRARTILELAASRPPGERVRCIGEHCADDLELRTEIESLLGRYGETPEFDAVLKSSVPPGDFHTTEISARAETPAAPELTTRTDSISAAGTKSWGDFTLLQELGRGGFGVVFRAWDPGLKREVALKLFNARLLGGAGERLLYEGQLLARVNHQHVVKVFSAIRIGDEVGLAMELIKGRTLSSLVSEEGPQGCEEAAVVGLSLCDALAAVHYLGLVHRDLKPSNVMRESGGRIVLMDFGAGRDQADAARAPEMVGTPAYVAPELLFGAEASAASDIYSLGVLLFYLVTARHPVSGKGFDQIRQAHLRGDRLSLAECRLDLPARFVEVVERALSRDAGDRYRTPQELKRDLAEAMPGLSHDDDTGSVAPSRSTATETRPVGVQASITRAVLGVLAAAVLSMVLGFVETAFLNLTLDRRGRFGTEPPMAYLRFGVQSLIAPLLYMGLAVLLFNVAAFAVRVSSRVVPSVARSVSQVRSTLQLRLQLVGLADPDTFVQALCVAAFLVLMVHVWAFSPLISAYAGVANAARAPAADLEILSSPRIAMHSMYHVVLAALILALVAGWRVAARAAARRRRGLSTGPVAGVAALLVILVILMAGPWRILFNDSFPEFTLDGMQCFIIGDAADEILIHCPAAAPPRNQVLLSSDPRIPRIRTYAKLFDAYAVVQAGR